MYFIGRKFRDFEVILRWNTENCQNSHKNQKIKPISPPRNLILTSGVGESLSKVKSYSKMIYSVYSGFIYLSIPRHVRDQGGWQYNSETPLDSLIRDKNCPVRDSRSYHQTTLSIEIKFRACFPDHWVYCRTIYFPIKNILGKNIYWVKYWENSGMGNTIIELSCILIQVRSSTGYHMLTYPLYHEQILS